MSTSALVGYDTDDDGNLVIIESEAKIVRIIYQSFVQGTHPKLIATRLNGFGMRTVYGNTWSSGAVQSILRNEKYCGDVLMQKTITIDYLTHASKINEGEAEQYFIADHHDPIVNRDIWNKAQELLDKSSWKKWKRRVQLRLRPVQSGRLVGFISINSRWNSISITRLMSASNRVDRPLKEETDVKSGGYESEEEVMPEKKSLEGFEVVDLEQGRSDSVMTLTMKNLKFNKATAVELDYPAYVRMLIDATTRRVAIEPCSGKTTNAVPFSKNPKAQTYAIVLKIPALLAAARKLAGFDEESDSLCFRGTLYPEDKVIIFDLTEGRPIKRRGGRRRVVDNEPEEQFEEELEDVEEIVEEPVVRKRGRPKKVQAEEIIEEAPKRKRGRPRKQ